MSERIKKLATWMQWEWIDPLHIKNKNGGYVFDGSEWNPYERIQDAWMLVDKARMDYKFYLAEGMFSDGWQCAFYKGLVSSAITGRTACEAICAAIEKLMEGESK